MNRFVLTAILLALSLAGLALSSARADFFNDNLLKDRSEDILLYRRIVGDAYPDKTGIPEPPPVPSIEPPSDATKPKISYSDSIHSETSLVKQYRKIEGLSIRPYSVMNLDQYMNRNLENNFYKKWSDPKKRMTAWGESSGEKKGGISDLDFVVPGSKALERFVGGQTRINIDGREKITFSGKSEWTEGQVETSVSKNSSFPSLTMKQEPSFRINGDVGRLHIDIKQDPQSGQFSNLEENISIKYQGEDRDIIKYIEAGNTSLSLEGATFAGYHGTHKGLFGIRAEGQLGPMNFTTIASQEKTESSMSTFRGSAEEASNQIRDYDYKTNTYFYLDFTYREQFRNNRDSFDLIHYDPADSMVVIEVYEDDSNVGNNLYEGTFALRGVAYPMNMLEGTEDPDFGVEGYYHKLEPLKDYYVNRSLGYIRFTRRVPEQSTIGVYIRTKDGREYGKLDYDTEDPNAKIELKLIKKKMQLPTDSHTWDLEWKNVYDLGQRNIEAEGLEIRVYREATDGVSKDTQDGVPFIHILGLDKQDELGGSTPDNKIDLNRGFINFYEGELMFPDLEPFNPAANLPGVSTELNEKVPIIYSTQNQQDMEEATKYYIEVVTSSRQSVIQVGSGFTGIMEGTEQVILNGKTLTKGTDYLIDYSTGRITLMNEEATSPTADLQIRYEEPNAMQEMQTTLVGVRTEFDILSDSRIGAVTLFKNESTKDKRVKLGQEPSRTLLFDTDAQFNFRSRLATRMLDVLPGLSASDPSTFKIETEFARSMPTLNTRGVVYIDDFEGSQNTPISVVRTNWTPSSPPDPETTGSMDMKRGALSWYNPWNRVKSEAIWPNKETTAGENTVHVLNMDYEKPEGAHDSEGYGGVMTSFYGAGADLSRSRFIEIWARGSKGDLKVDIGSISEDFFPYDNPNGFLDTEDVPIPGQGYGDGVLVTDEDTGLDGLFDSEEKAYYAALADTTSDSDLRDYYLGLSVLKDPAGDNFYYNSSNKNDYSGINGMEGSASDGDRLGIPDTEDINNNGILDTRDSYYEYSLSFSDPNDPYLVPDSVPEGEPYGWRLFRIPLWNNAEAVQGGISAPDSTLIEFMRMWVTGTDATVLQIASIEIVESSWLEQGIEGDMILDDNVRVTNVNTHENLDYFPPPGVKAEIDPETKIRRKEQSLVLQVEQLQPGNNALIYRNFEKMNFTDYSSLRMYVHGPDEFSDQTSDVEMILRFGADKINYYEYRTDVYRGWDGRNYVEINFEDCTGLKLIPWNERYLEPAEDADLENEWYQAYLANPDSVAATLETWYEAYLSHPEFVKAVEDTIASKYYAIEGSPSLDNIKIISVGALNKHDSEPMDFELWLDELRMDAERDMTGSAARVNINTNLAGFMNIVAGGSKKEDDFHDMNSKTGSGQDATDWNANVTMNMDRFTPKRWNLQLPVSASTKESSALPRLMSGSDIILDENQKEEYKSTSSDNKYRVSFSKSRDQSQEILNILSLEDYKTISFNKVKGTAIHWAFDKVNASYDYGEDDSSSPFSGQTYSDNTQLNVKYDVDPVEFEKKKKLMNWLPVLPFERYEKFADLEFTLTPSELNYEYKHNTRNQAKINVEGVKDETLTDTVDETYNFGYEPFDGLRYTFTRQTKDDLDIGQEVSFVEQNRISLTGPSMVYLQNSYSYSANYNETDNPRYSLQSSLGSKSIRLSKSFTFTGSLEVNKFFEDISGRPKAPRQKFQREKKKEDEWESGGEGDEEQKPDGDAMPEPPDPGQDNRDHGEETGPGPGSESEPGSGPGPNGRKPGGSPNVSAGQTNGRRNPGRRAAQAPPDKKDNGKKPSDSEGEDASEDKEEKGPGIRTRLLMGVSSALSPISLDYTTNDNISYSGIADRPDFATRFGRGAIDEPDSITVISSQNSIAEAETYSARTKLSLPLDIGISLSSKYSTNDTDSPSASSSTENTTPLDVSLNWTSLEKKIPKVDKYLSSLSVNSTYSMNDNKSWQDGELRTDKSASKFSPLFSVNSKLFNKLQFSFSFNNSKDNTDDFSGTSTSHSETTDKGMSTSLKYTITSARGLPLFKNIKLNSNIDLSMTFSTSASESRRGINDEPMTLVSSTDSWSWSPKTEYRFSSKFRGGMSMNFRNSVDMTDKTTKMREVSIWGEMTF